MKRSYFDTYATPPDSPLTYDFETDNKMIQRNPERIYAGVLIPAQGAVHVSDEIAIMLNRLTDKIETDNDGMVTDNDEEYGTGLKVLMFLDAQGKEFMDLLLGCDDVIFATANASNGGLMSTSLVPTTTNDQCVALAKYFGILSPVGGGVFPLNYMVIIVNNRVRVRVPIRLSTLNRYERFGVDIRQLPHYLYDLLYYVNNE